MAEQEIKQNRALNRFDVHFVQALLSHAPISKIPSRATPMLATLVDAPFDSEGWTYKIK